MAITFVNSVSAGSTDGNTFTTGAKDMTGANFLVALVASYDAQAAPVITDSLGNTWTVRTDYSGAGDRIQVVYAKNPTVGAAQTFTATRSPGYTALMVMGFAGVDTTSPYDTESGQAPAGNVSARTANGPITPAANGSLVVTGLNLNAVVTGLAVDGGFTKQETVAYVSGQHFGGACAYLIQGAAAASNPSWSWTTATLAGACQAVFKAAAVVGGDVSAQFQMLKPLTMFRAGRANPSVVM